MLAQPTIETRAKERATTITLPDGSEAGRVLARDCLDNGYWYIHGLRVRADVRGQGHGRRLMDQVLTLYGALDRLELIVTADGDGGLTIPQLTAWYTRLGFLPGPSASGREHDSDHRRMYRPPSVK